MYSRVLRRGATSSSLDEVHQDVIKMISSNSLLLWELELTTAFLRKLCRLRHPKVLVQMMRALGQLGDGDTTVWHRVESCHARLPIKCLSFAHPNIPLRSYCVVFSVGINTDQSMQKLTMWAVTKKSNLHKKLKYVEQLLDQFSSKYLTNCRLQETFLPQSVVLPANDVLCDTVGTEDQAVECVALMKMYNVSRSWLKYMATNANANDVLLKLQLPYKLDEKEMQVINCGQSVLALGRSGTGKTSVLCRKILETDLAGRNLSLLHGVVCTGESETIESQVFVTSNHYLRENVEQEFRKWQQSAIAIGHNSTNALDHMDSTIASASYVLTKRQADTKRVSFPCFLTFDDVLFGMDGLLCPDGSNFFDHDEALELRAQSKRRRHDFRKRVTLELFESIYWADMPASVRRITTAGTLFKQLQHHMKGSLEVMTLNPSGKSFLKLVEHYYLEKTHRTHTMSFACEERREIVKALKKYEMIKWQRGEWDYPDACYEVFHGICAKPMAFRRQLEANYLYVDEMQDLIPAQVVVLSLLCRNTLHGLLLFGDAAQCVAPESDYCFAELKDLIFKWWLRCDPRVDYALRQKIKPHDKTLASSMPQMFHLVRNYRCRNEVLKLANFVIELLQQCFPGSLDYLEKEQSLIVNDAFKPVVIQGTFIESLLQEIPCDATTGLADLTAEDVLLVQNRDVKNALCSTGLFLKRNVLTITESKGLEFARVIIYNFFKDSGAAANWKVLFRVDQPSVQTVCSTRHRWLLKELRALYVAITRAKEVVLFYDEDQTARHPFVEVATKRGLVRLNEEGRSPAHGCFRFLGTRHQAVGWFDRGEMFLRQGLLEEALQCFEQAKDHTGRIVFVRTLQEKRQLERELSFSTRDRARLHEKLVTCARTFVGLMEKNIPWDPDATALAIECFESGEAFEELSRFYYSEYFPPWLS